MGLFGFCRLDCLLCLLIRLDVLLFELLGIVCLFGLVVVGNFVRDLGFVVCLGMLVCRLLTFLFLDCRVCLCVYGCAWVFTLLFLLAMFVLVF